MIFAVGLLPFACASSSQRPNACSLALNPALSWHYFRNTWFGENWGTNQTKLKFCKSLFGTWFHALQKNSVLAELRFEQKCHVAGSVVSQIWSLDHFFSFSELAFVFTIDFLAPSKLSLVVMSLHVNSPFNLSTSFLVSREWPVKLLRSVSSVVAWSNHGLEIRIWKDC